MCPARGKRNLHIRNRSARQNPRMLFFFQMCQNQTLPVLSQNILAAVCIENESAACFARLHQQMHFRIMPQRFIMSNALDSRLNRFFIKDAAFIKFDKNAETLLHELFQYLYLHFAHQLYVHLTKLFFPDDVKLRLLFFKLT